MNGDLVVTLELARMLRRIRNAGRPLSRHDLYHGTTGCSAADVKLGLQYGLVVEVPNPRPRTTMGTGGARRPLVALTALGLNVLGVFRFPAPGRKATRKPAEDHPWRLPFTDAPGAAVPALDADDDCGLYLSDLLGRCRSGDTLVVD